MRMWEGGRGEGSVRMWEGGRGVVSEDVGGRERGQSEESGREGEKLTCSTA